MEARVIITTNHKADGIYLPADDRRHFVAWSDLTKEDFPPDYWKTLWDWYERGGYGHVATYLAELDISAFNPKAPPPKTNAFWDIVDASRAPEEAELADAIDQLGNPEATTLTKISSAALGDQIERRIYGASIRAATERPKAVRKPSTSLPARSGTCACSATRDHTTLSTSRRTL